LHLAIRDIGEQEFVARRYPDRAYEELKAASHSEGISKSFSILRTI